MVGPAMPGAASTQALEKLLPVAAWAALLFVAYCTLSPLQQRPALPLSVGFEHISAFALVGVLFCLAYPKQLVLISMLVLGSAVLLEIAQLMTPDRHGRVHDVIEKIIGGVVGIAAGRALLYYHFGQAARRFRK